MVGKLDAGKVARKVGLRIAGRRKELGRMGAAGEFGGVDFFAEKSGFGGGRVVYRGVLSSSWVDWMGCQVV